MLRDKDAPRGIIKKGRWPPNHRYDIHIARWTPLYPFTGFYKTSVNPLEPILDTYGAYRVAKRLETTQDLSAFCGSGEPSYQFAHCGRIG